MKTIHTIYGEKKSLAFLYKLAEETRKLEDLCKLIPKFPERLRRMVPWLFLIGLSIASLVKTLHYNPYENYLTKKE